MTLQKLTRLALFLFIAGLVCSCSEGDDPAPPPDPCEGTSYTYTADIGPIIDEACAVSGCHDGSNRLSILNNYSGVNSLRFQLASAIRSDFAGLPPQAMGRLTETEQAQILCWVENGAPE